MICDRCITLESERDHARQEVLFLKERLKLCHEILDTWGPLIDELDAKNKNLRKATLLEAANLAVEKNCCNAQESGPCSNDCCQAKWEVREALMEKTQR